MGIFSNLFQKREKTPNAQQHIDKKDSVVEYGDYAKTVFLWITRKAMPIQENNHYIQYLTYDCQIKQAWEYHSQLLLDGYYQKASFRDMLDLLKAAELKTILKEAKMPTSGKKDELIERIPENMEPQIVKKYFPYQLYVISEKGLEFIKRHYDYVRLYNHRNWGVDWREYDARHTCGQSFYDVIWGIFNERLMNNLENDVASQYYFMYQLLEEEGKREMALEKLLLSIYADVSGTKMIKYVTLYKQGYVTKKEIKDDFDLFVSLSPGVLNILPSYKDVYSENLVDRVYSHQLPVQICNKKLFLDLINSAMNNAVDYEKVLKKLKTAYNKMVKEL